MDKNLHIVQILRLVRKIFKTTPLLTAELNNKNSNGEKSIEMDVKIENQVIEYIKLNKLPYKIFAEENGDVEVCEQPRYYVTFDPLDGSTNYSIGQNLLPYGFLMCIYSGLKPKLSDIVAAGAYEVTTNSVWIYENGKTYAENKNLININKHINADMHTPVYIDLYKKKSYDFYSKIAQKVYIRNTGSTIGNLNLTLSKASKMLAGSVVKPEEIGTVYALIKGAGGLVVTEKGQDLGDLDFSTGRTYDVIAGNPDVVRLILSLLNKN